MKKLHKSKKGFTLIEMVLVIGIIVVLVAAVAFSIGQYISNASSAAISVSEHNSILYYLSNSYAN